MNIKEELRLSIYEACNESVITNDEKEYLFTVTENVIGDIIRKVDFKKRYHYDSKEKTIKVCGETYKVDLDTKSPIVYVSLMTGDKIPILRQTSATLQGNKEEDAFIILDNKFFKIKGKKQREALLQHEIGHLKMHSLNTKSKYLDKRFITKDEVDNHVDPKVEKQYLHNKKGTKEEREERDKIREAAKKYEDPDCYHSVAKEFEADRYAANRTSEKDLIDGLKQLYKVSGKKLELLKTYVITTGVFPSKEELGAMQIKQKAYGEIDLNSREKALKDEVLKNAKLLKKGMKSKKK